MSIMYSVYNERKELMFETSKIFNAVDSAKSMAEETGKMTYVIQNKNGKFREVGYQPDGTAIRFWKE